MNEIKISRVLHAGYVFSYGDTQILFDPIFENPFSRNCFAYPSVQFDTEAIRRLQFSAIFISHYHDDHCSFDSLNLLDKSIPIYIYCIHPQLLQMIKELGFTSVTELTINSTVAVGTFQVTTRKALDAEVDSIFHIQAGEFNILNVVDSWIDQETMQLLCLNKTWDLILWPFQTMRELEVLSPLRVNTKAYIPVEWKQQLRQLDPRFLIPSSCQFIHEEWSWYNDVFFPISYQRFTEEISLHLEQTEIFRLNPGESFILSHFGCKKIENLPWIKPVGPQDVDYHYKPERPVPPMREVSQHMAQLSKSQMDFVVEFCKNGLLDQFRALEWPESKYFLNKNYWKLSIYDHQGQAMSFHYLVHRNKIEILDHDLSDVTWLTEIAAAKIYSGLHEGESLTSMYLRINDMPFSKALELEIADSDILEDPLIRVLFNGQFGAYQKAQLDRIKGLK